MQKNFKEYLQETKNDFLYLKIKQKSSKLRDTLKIAMSTTVKAHFTTASSPIQTVSNLSGQRRKYIKYKNSALLILTPTLSGLFNLSH